MKTRNFTLTLALVIFSLVAQPFTSKAQSVADFENLTLAPNSFWNGSAMPLGTTFTSADAIFPNNYDTSFGGYWSSGWAYSNVLDTTTAGFSNLYGARPGSGYNGSSNYVVGTQNSLISFSNAAAGTVRKGFYVTNGTYAALSMENGDNFAKKFGDTTGTNCNCPQGSVPDYFLLTVNAYYNGTLLTDSVDFYLADFRGPDSTDYIIKDWQWVDLTSLGNVDSVVFKLRSSDVGQFGMNTPAFFCLDNFTSSNIALSVDNTTNTQARLYAFPNPVMNKCTLSFDNVQDQYVQLRILDVTGKVILNKSISTKNAFEQDFSSFNQGLYLISVVGENTHWSTKIMKR